MVLSGNLGSSSGNVLIAPESVADSGDAIQLGLASTAQNVLALTDDDWFISGKEIQIGDANSGPITVAGDFSPFPHPNSSLLVAGINFTGGSFDVGILTPIWYCRPAPRPVLAWRKLGAM